jgi:IS605 OrfB family transposase
MNLTLQIKLLPDAEQVQALLATMRAFNAAANYAVGVAFDLKMANKIELQKHVYQEIRQRFGIPADMAIRVIAQAVEAYKRDKSILPTFQPLASVPYSHGKNYGFRGLDKVSLQVTPSGRLIMPFVCGDHQRTGLEQKRGQADLVHRDGMFFLHVTIETPDVEIVAVQDYIGVDLGIVQIAVATTGEQFSGEKVEKTRRRSSRARQTYQRRGTRSSRCRLRKLANRQGRFQRNENHRISKELVTRAKALGTGIALEDLSGIRKRCEETAGRSLRRGLGNWGFYQLRTFVEYKAKLAGVPVVFVDPRNTSRTCSQCGHCEKGNRKSQSQFLCKQCGYSCNADHNGAANIRLRALGVSVNNPQLVATPG